VKILVIKSIPRAFFVFGVSDAEQSRNFQAGRPKKKVVKTFFTSKSSGKKKDSPNEGLIPGGEKRSIQTYFHTKHLSKNMRHPK
jgi:hypothetical protein